MRFSLFQIQSFRCTSKYFANCWSVKCVWIFPCSKFKYLNVLQSNVQVARMLNGIRRYISRGCQHFLRVWWTLCIKKKFFTDFVVYQLKCAEYWFLYYIGPFLLSDHFVKCFRFSIMFFNTNCCPKNKKWFQID